MKTMALQNVPAEAHYKCCVTDGFKLNNWIRMEIGNIPAVVYKCII